MTSSLNWSPTKQKTESNLNTFPEVMTFYDSSPPGWKLPGGSDPSLAAAYEVKTTEQCVSWTVLRRTSQVAGPKILIFSNSHFCTVSDGMPWFPSFPLRNFWLNITSYSDQDSHCCSSPPLSQLDLLMFTLVFPSFLSLRKLNKISMISSRSFFLNLLSPGYLFTGETQGSYFFIYSNSLGCSNIGQREI